MKFAEHLAAHITPEWRKQYIHYEVRKNVVFVPNTVHIFYGLILHQDMKALLYQAVEQAPSAEVVEPEVLARYYTKFDEQFFTFCDKELAMINTFYAGLYFLFFWISLIDIL